MLYLKYGIAKREVFSYGIQLQQTMEAVVDRKMSRTEMRKQAGISTNILAKMGKDEPVSMDSLAKICIALGCTLDDIVEISTDIAAGGKANGKE